MLSDMLSVTYHQIKEKFGTWINISIINERDGMKNIGCHLPKYLQTGWGSVNVGPKLAPLKPPDLRYTYDVKMMTDYKTFF